jgi:hypothetical protein
METLADAIEWDVRLENFSALWPGRPSFLQACINYLQTQNDRLSGLAAGQFPWAEGTPWANNPNSWNPPNSMNSLGAETDDVIPLNPKGLSLKTRQNQPR